MTPRQARRKLQELIGTDAEFAEFMKHFQVEHLRLPATPHTRHSRALLSDDPEGMIRRSGEVLCGGEVQFDFDAAPEKAARTHRPGTAAECLDLAQKQGYVVSFAPVWPAFPHLASLKRAFELLFSTNMISSLFWGPPNSKGLRLHYDPVDMLAFQLKGEKTWKVERGANIHPNPWWRISDSGREVPGDYCFHTLREGDLLYVPAGHRHATVAGSQGSIHLNICFRPMTLADKLHALVDYLSDEEVDWRKTNWGMTDPRSRAWDLESADPLLETAQQRLCEELPRLQTASFDGEAVCKALSMHRARFIKSMPWLPLPSSIPEISSTTRLRIHEMMIGEIVVTGKSATLYYPGGTMSGPKQIAPALCHILDEENFTPAGLPGPLTEKSKIRLVHQLMRYGLVEVDRSTKQARDRNLAPAPQKSPDIAVLPQA